MIVVLKKGAFGSETVEINADAVVSKDNYCNPQIVAAQQTPTTVFVSTIADEEFQRIMRQLGFRNSEVTKG